MSNNSSTYLPFSRFNGHVKQIRVESAPEDMVHLFNMTFARFQEIDQMKRSLLDAGVETLVTAAGLEHNFGFRPRRFAGGGGLQPGSFYSVCSDERYDDGGTLRDEMLAYFSPSANITVKLFDSAIDKGCKEYCVRSGVHEAMLQEPFYLMFYKIEKENGDNKSIGAPGDQFASTYGALAEHRVIDDVIDLRLPETQKWFLNTFVNMEIENEEAAHKTYGIHSPKEPIEEFGSLLKIIASIETGGGMIFNQAIGHWLRQSGVNALVFPSARSNCYSKVKNGVVSDCHGWNLVDYRNADPVEDLQLFGRMTTWSDPDHDHIWVHYQDQRELKGSFSIRGTREFNLLDFDRRLQLAAGVRESSPIGDITGITNETNSRRVRQILEKERDVDTIWFADVNYHDFLEFHEALWRPEEQDTADEDLQINIPDHALPVFSQMILALINQKPFRDAIKSVDPNSKDAFATYSKIISPMIPSDDDIILSQGDIFAIAKHMASNIQDGDGNVLAISARDVFHFFSQVMSGEVSDA